MKDIGQRESSDRDRATGTCSNDQDLHGRAFWTEYAAAKYPLVFAHLAERELATRKSIAMVERGFSRLRSVQQHERANMSAEYLESELFLCCNKQ